MPCGEHSRAAARAKSVPRRRFSVATVARRWKRNVLANLVAVLPRSGERSYSIHAGERSYFQQSPAAALSRVASFDGRTIRFFASRELSLYSLHVSKTVYFY
jgi:hypothetical protein